MPGTAMKASRRFNVAKKKDLASVMLCDGSYASNFDCQPVMCSSAV